MVQDFDIGVFFVDYYVWMSGVDCNVIFFVWMFDYDFGYVGVFEMFFQYVMDFEIFVQQFCVFICVGILVGFLCVVDVEVQIDWIYFLFYQVVFLIL